MEVTEHGKAAVGDLRPGDIIIAINGESAAEMLNVEAQNKIKQSPGQLQLQVERWVLSPGGGGTGTAAWTPVSPAPGKRGARVGWSPQSPLHELFFASGDSWGCAIPAGACPGSVIKRVRR